MGQIGANLEVVFLLSELCLTLYFEIEILCLANDHQIYIYELKKKHKIKSFLLQLTF